MSQAKEDPKATASSSSPLEAEPSVEVLVVDDQEMLRTLYRMALERGGPFEVVAEAENGALGIEKAAEHAPDLVLLDLSMPGMDGMEALPRIKEASPSSVVVILSGFLEERFGDPARERGAAAYIEKGDHPEELVERLASILDVEARPQQDRDEAPRFGSTPSDEELETFAYVASHDLQEPLRTVQMYLRMLQDGYRDRLDEEGREMIHYATAGAERMQEMIDSLLGYSRIQTRGYDPEPVSLENVLDDTLASLEHLLDEAGTMVERGSLPEALVDPTQASMLFQNLIENVAKYGGEGARVRIEATQEDGHVEIRVQDDGPGIPEDEQEHCFSLAWRGSTATGVSGSGMGLAICKRIIDRHEGSIWIDASPGEGTTVHVRLPAPQEPTEEAAS